MYAFYTELIMFLFIYNVCFLHWIDMVFFLLTMYAFYIELRWGFYRQCMLFTLNWLRFFLFTVFAFYIELICFFLLTMYAFYIELIMFLFIYMQCMLFTLNWYVSFYQQCMLFTLKKFYHTVKPHYLELNETEKTVWDHGLHDISVQETRV
jgi:hypothetical protein